MIKVSYLAEVLADYDKKRGFWERYVFGGCVPSLKKFYLALPNSNLNRELSPAELLNLSRIVVEASNYNFRNLYDGGCCYRPRTAIGLFDKIFARLREELLTYSFWRLLESTYFIETLKKYYQSVLTAVTQYPTYAAEIAIACFSMVRFAGEEGKTEAEYIQETNNGLTKLFNMLPAFIKYLSEKPINFFAAIATENNDDATKQLLANYKRYVDVPMSKYLDEFFTRQERMAFLMGLHPRLGAESSIYKFFGATKTQTSEEKEVLQNNNPLGDIQIVKHEVFKFLAES